MFPRLTSSFDYRIEGGCKGLKEILKFALYDILYHCYDDGGGGVLTSG